jgi:hypothetical protein
MWIRDQLPRALPDIRYILYGYDSPLLTNSFQTIFDLSSGLVEQMRGHGWTLSTNKPLLFLAHSLGGVILKQAFTIVANHLDYGPLKNAIRGAILFGVPNFGMEQSALAAIVEGEASEVLIGDLAPSSQYLMQLHDQTEGLAFLQDVVLHWAYESRESPTVVVRILSFSSVLCA